MLLAIITLPLGTWLWGLKFFAVVAVIGMLCIGVGILIWLYTAIAGAGRWARRQ